MIDNKDSCSWRYKQSRYILNRLSSGGRGRRGESRDGRVQGDSNECKKFSFHENLR